MVHAIVGSGGKTTLIHSLARKYRAEGRRVFVTTTTHMFTEPDTLLTADADAILEALERTGYAMAGLPEGEKITPLPREVYLRVCGHADAVLVEADGSRQLPLKFPGPGEPVIPENADSITVVCGLRALGKPIRDVTHRFSLAAERLGISPETPAAPEHIEALLKTGYLMPLRQRFPRIPVRVHAVTDGSDAQLSLAARLEML